MTQMFYHPEMFCGSWLEFLSDALIRFLHSDITSISERGTFSRMNLYAFSLSDLNIFVYLFEWGIAHTSNIAENVNLKSYIIYHFSCPF